MTPGGSGSGSGLGRERAIAWLVFVAAVAFIASTLSLAFDVSSFLRARGFLWPTVRCLFVACACGLAYLLFVGAGLRDSRPYLRALPALLAYGCAMIWMRRSPAERFHFLEYGLLYLLALRAISIDARGWQAYVLAAVATSLAGWMDEGLQGITPQRYFDWGDVRMNVVAAMLAAVVTAALFGRTPALSRFPHLPEPRPEWSRDRVPGGLDGVAILDRE